MNSRAQVEDSLRRIEDRIAALEKIKDPAARLAARQLFETVLDLHGLALAKITARLSADPQARGLYQEMGNDEQIKAVLLLYGLHPDSVEDRIRAAISPLQTQLGVCLHVTSVNDGIARIMMDPGTGDFEALCSEVGRALIDAAPDLDDIAIDRAVSVGMTVADTPRAALG